MTLEDEPLRLEGVQHATEEEWGTSTNSSRGNKVVGPKPKGRSVVIVPGSERNLGQLDVVKQEMARINIDILDVSELK